MPSLAIKMAHRAIPHGSQYGRDEWMLFFVFPVILISHGHGHRHGSGITDKWMASFIMAIQFVRFIICFGIVFT